MSEIGSLLIRLQASTAEFQDDLGKVKQQLDDLANKSKETGDSMDHSFGEARGGLMLTEDVLGVRLPRHLNNLIAQIPGVGAAFATMLPIVGVILAIDIIGKLIEKHREARAAMLESTVATGQFQTKQQDLVLGLADANLRLADQIALLEDRPEQNRLAIALDEVKKKTDELVSSFQTDFAKINKEIETTTGIVELFEEAFGKGGGFTDDKARALDALAAAQNKLNAAERAQGAIDPKKNLDQWKVATGQVATEAGNLQTAFDHAYQAVQRVDPADKALESLKRGAIAAKAEWQSMGEQITNVGLTITKVHDEDRKDNLKPLKEEAALQKTITAGVDAHAAAQRKLNDTIAETNVAADKGNQDESIQAHLEAETAAAEREKQSAIDAANQVLASKKNLYDSEVKANSDSKAKLKELDQQWKNDEQTAADVVAQAVAEAEKRTVTATATATKERTQMAIKAAQERADGELAIALKGAKDDEKAAMQDAKDREQLHNASAAQTLNAQIAAINAERNAEIKGYNDRISALDKFDKDVEKKTQDNLNKIKEINKTADDQIEAEIKAAEQKKLLDIQQAENKMKEAVASDVAKSIVENKNLAASFRQTGQEMIEGMMKNFMLMVLMHDKTKLVKAKDAAVKSYDWAADWGGPPAGAAAAALSFAAVMSFEVGGKIPGAGAVPIIGHGGETVVTKALTDRVERAEGNGRSGGDTHVHATFAPQIHALDSSGVEGSVKTLMPIFKREITSIIRKMNR